VTFACKENGLGFGFGSAFKLKSGAVVGASRDMASSSFGAWPGTTFLSLAESLHGNAVQSTGG